MPATIEDIYHSTAGGNDNVDPPIYTAERNEDGEGDSRRFAAEIDTIEVYANSGNVIELSGVSLAEAVYTARKHSEKRERARIPTGRILIRREIPYFLS